MAASYADRLSGCRPALRRVVGDGRQGGAAASAVNALLLLCHDAFDGGSWQEAGRTAEEGRAWGEELGYRLAALRGGNRSAPLAAARGDDRRVKTMTGELVEWQAARAVRLLADFAPRRRGTATPGS